MAHDIWVTNREAVIHWLERTEGELRRFRDILQDSRDGEMLELFARVQLERDSLINNPPRRKMESTRTFEKGSEALVDMLIGRMTAEKLRRAQRELPELMKKSAESTTPKADTERRPSLADRVAEDIRRDLEKLEKKRAEKEAGDKGGH